MAAFRFLTSQGSGRGRHPGDGSGDERIRLLASFPDVDRPSDPPAMVSEPAAESPDRPAMPRIGWGSIAMLLIIAAAMCTAAWRVDRGPIDPGTAEIERARLAERPATGIQGVQPRGMNRRR